MNKPKTRASTVLSLVCTLAATGLQEAHAEELKKVQDAQKEVQARLDLVTGLNPSLLPLTKRTHGAGDAHITLLGNTEEFGFHGGVNIGAGIDWRGIIFETKPLGLHTGWHEAEFEIAYSHESFIRKGDVEIGFSYSLGAEGLDELRVPLTWRNIAIVPYLGEHGPGADFTVLCGKGDLRLGLVAGYNVDAVSFGVAWYGGHSHVH